MKIIKYCIICARAGSKGVKNKNIVKLNNKLLIDYTIENALKSKLFDKVIITTDIKKILKKYKSSKKLIVLKRRKKLSNDTSEKILSIRDAVLRVENKTREKSSIVFDLDITSPLRKIIDIKKAFKIFNMKNLDNLFSVNESRKNPYFNMVEITKENKVKKIKKLQLTSIVRRQDAPKVFDMNASIYIWKRKVLFSKSYLFRKKTGIYIMPFKRSIDIDSKDDLSLVKHFKNK